ncbi:DUF6382 domain-containing protein [Paenibacillus aestuarii]|uniref:DUF6382 domain-containing protein n=1 Tax=Paenibacillus aestuarii TaxID=516965 RepID=A0ABW0KID1_9BACL|nr:DUF6382 domain-containing protein [Paenibacillus aestuarii]
MNQEIFGLKYDFIYRQGHYMELYQDEGIAPEQLSALQLRMLEANQVPHLLPFEVREFDNRLSLLYKLSPRRMLNQALKNESLNQQNFAKLFYAIISALEESHHYMLHQDGYVMKENFIFLGVDWSDVYLTYVPLTHIDEGGRQLEDFGLLMERIADKVRDEDLPHVKSMIEEMSLIHDHSRLKEKLLARMQPPQAEKQSERNHFQGNRNELTAVQGLKSQQSVESPIYRGLPKPVLNQQPRLTPMPSEIYAPANEPLHMTNTKASFLKLSNRSQLIVAAVCFLLVAFLWKNYMTYPADATLRFTVGLTLLFADICFIVTFIGIPLLKREQSVKQAPSRHQDILIEQKLQISEADQQVSVEEYYRNLHMHTTLLNPSEPDQTVYLGLNNHMTRAPEIILEYIKEGQSQSVHITSKRFTIGRGEKGKLDHVIDVPGVSRMHAEINQLEGTYELIDLGSTNGTSVNEQALAAHQPYVLQDGDVIRIASVELIFRLK